MLSQRRRDLLLEELRLQGAVEVTALAQRWGVTPVTVRRDITLLAHQGLLERVHGGAVSVQHTRLRDRDRERQPHESEHAPRARFSIGLVVPSMDFYWPQTIFGAQSAAAARGGRVTVRASSYDAAEDKRQINSVLEAGVQGLVVAPSVEGRAGTALLRWIAALQIPTVLMERQPAYELSSALVDVVRTDNRRGAGLALRHLYGQGHRRVGVFTSAQSPSTAAIRTGWLATAEQLGLDLDGTPDLTAPPFGRPGWRRGIDTFLAHCRDAGTTAVLVHSDPEAIAFLQRAQDLGIRVPDDLSVIAYDDEMPAVTTPALTAVRPPKSAVGVQAVELVVARLADAAPRPVQEVRLRPDLVLRDSTAPPPPTR